MQEQKKQNKQSPLFSLFCFLSAGLVGWLGQPETHRGEPRLTRWRLCCRTPTKEREKRSGHMCTRSKAKSYSMYLVFPISRFYRPIGVRRDSCIPPYMVVRKRCIGVRVVLTCFGLATIRSNSSTFPTVWISFVVTGEAIALIGVRVPPTSRRAPVATAPAEEAPIVRGFTTNACPQW